MLKVWQWRNRGGGLWRLHSNGQKPTIWWLQMEYRTIDLPVYSRYRLDAPLKVELLTEEAYTPS